ncbi:L-2-amino-thiazoline-4-carboxylic acid hydrolase [Nonomuraea typhae]|uniref:L-2-amino-thiazoline-4-carboxylic acid hydrolase n=1 Tax=Nonomuraea typhae TaxID=2603600 RepID=UPI0012FC1809|nr:L-2-amino-thiazoline-4-carboxylic acid hydrolase [Nonomuraea typhae]
MNEQEYRALMRTRLADYLRLREDMGDERARESILESYVRRQEQRMGTLIRDNTLAEGFSKVTRVFDTMGVHIEIVDVSGDGVDAAVEILTTCECQSTCDDLGLTEPLTVLCELDNEAARRAFPGLKVEVLRQHVRGAHMCVFRYSRQAP